MNENRCPNCDLLNLPDADICLQCKTPISPTRQTDASVSAAQTRDNYRQNSQTDSQTPPPTPFRTESPFSQTVQQKNRIGQRTHFWYRVFCSLIVVAGIVTAIFGLLAILGSMSMEGQEGTEAFAGGLFFLLVGLPPAILFFLGVVFPAKPFNWFYGVFLLGLSIISCFLAPFAILLLIFWMKPETQVFFERK